MENLQTANALPATDAAIASLRSKRTASLIIFGALVGTMGLFSLVNETMWGDMLLGVGIGVLLSSVFAAINDDVCKT